MVKVFVLQKVFLKKRYVCAFYHWIIIWSVLLEVGLLHREIFSYVELDYKTSLYAIEETVYI